MKRQKGYASDAELLLGIIAAVFLLFVLITALVYAGSMKACYAKWAASDFQAKFGLWTDCMISKDGKVWIPAENYREVAP